MIEPGFINWDEPNDGENEAEMAEARNRARLESERQENVNRILWERYSGHYDKEGRVIAPFKLV